MMASNSNRNGCLGFFLKLVGATPKSNVGRGSNVLPYQLRDKFLSAAELAFYRVLEQAVGDSLSINNKVRLWDVIYAPQNGDSRKYNNKVRSKHIDFLLCDPVTMQPVLVIELDDASHKRKDRKERDSFVDQALAVAGLEILHVPAARSYSITDIQQQIAAGIATAPQSAVTPVSPTVNEASPSSGEPSCPACHTTMVQRKATKGKNAGKRFWACTNFPQCREIIGID